MDNKTLSLEHMKNMSIDQIVELYRNGYEIENLQTCEDLGCVSRERLDDANRLIITFGSAGVLLTILGIFGMVAAYFAGRESCKKT